ncbi:hypothetical protein RS130_01935 [Paraglaciecola aquimarina]|uniref:Integron Cassette Protein Hfx-Cass5 domain-containing protein n=1 Tax=Paraglaciecola aquimarina TaxID=1235557 RepID=A0ABU3SS84_9ALTE|nr:hypothetical protein [Paraglaciecola aquimarina]MDU0352845.1 hypothetical protein [Paraglaciecola aquimarina]
MEREIIKGVHLNDTKELLLMLESGGKSMYQHVYRAAAGVYWDNESGGFKSTPIAGWSCSRWFSHIITAVSYELGVKLVLGENVNWQNVPEADITEIVQHHAI